MRPIAIMLLLASLVCAEPTAIYGGRVYTPSNYSHAYGCSTRMCRSIVAQWNRQLAQGIGQQTGYRKVWKCVGGVCGWYNEPITVQRAIPQLAKAVRHVPTTGAVAQPKCEGYTPHDVIEAIFRIVKPQKGDRFVDAGSGDGRIVIAAAKAGFAAKGVELDARTVEASRKAIEGAGAEVYQGNADGDWYRYATHVFVYQHTDLQAKIIKRLRPGTVLITYAHHPGMGADVYRRESDGATFYIVTIPDRTEFRKVTSRSDELIDQRYTQLGLK